MRIFLPLLCALCATPVHGIFDGTCPKKDPPPGLLVLSPGSKLVLSCSGHVEADGVKVSSNINRKGSPSDATPTSFNITSNTEALTKSAIITVENTVSGGHHSNTTEAEESKSLKHSETAYTASPSPQPVWENRDYGEEEDEDGSRVTRSIKPGLQWKWNGRTVGKGNRDWGEVSFERRGASLSLSSVRLSDSGRYTCYLKGRERFSLKVKVADPPETPQLSCYKKSPSSKIRCEWAPQKPFTIFPNCSLFLSKSARESFLPLQCSYSSKHSRCWCALDHNEDELRTNYMAYLCVTSIAGNATSSLLSFMPLNILKPDPPSGVSVRQEEGQAMRMTVTWSLPISWKSQDSFYELIHEIKYRPLKSFDHWQTHTIKGRHSYTIRDAMPGVEYVIQLRTREEYDGHWSDWSTPVYESSWTAKVSVEYDDLTATTFSVYTEGSGADDDLSDVPEPVLSGNEGSRHLLWISGSFALLSVILAVFTFRHRDRFMSKLKSRSVSTHGDSAQPATSAQTPPEGHPLVTFAPLCNKEPPPSEMEESEEEKQRLKERMEALHFNNGSYFFLQRD
ncbi:hypothetical protein PBY51_017699 [Eleginops maclovinus]|uniref:Fibronectin type-III domain-containing protein n=1 Tax=Eleginops maclovinus TaxID=56733 RepID=A0AAN8AJI2_ELEMC|nr:hypothetical protein PBY51_017699 [Eleginops maclovinus]